MSSSGDQSRGITISVDHRTHESQKPVPGPHYIYTLYLQIIGSDRNFGSVSGLAVLGKFGLAKILLFYDEMC